MAFERNVFINCPFDEEYYGLLRPILFTTIYLGFKPRIALERADSGEARVAKIIELVRDSKYAIHDLSRLKAREAGEFFRLNMPFELGVDVGCRSFGKGRLTRKRCLILEAERYRYQAAISDLSGSDIGVHHNEPKTVVTEVRNWLASQGNASAAGPAKIWGAFNDFMAWNYRQLTEQGFSKQDVEALSVPELLFYMKRWVSANT